MSDEFPVEAEFANEAGEVRSPNDVDASPPTKRGVALSVLWWFEGEPERASST